MIRPKSRGYRYIFFELVSKYANLVAKKLGNSVDDTNNEAYTKEANNTENEGNEILCLKETKNSEDTGEKTAKEEEENELKKLGEVLELRSDCFSCQFMYSLSNCTRKSFSC